MVRPADGGSSGPTAQFAVEVDTLKTFRDRVDALLKSLDAGAGSAKSIGAQVMDPGHPGSGFAEVDALVARYQETHAKLAELSQTLSSTIDAMTISIDVARFGYRNVDEGELGRLWQIHDQAALGGVTTQPAATAGSGTADGTSPSPTM